MRFIQEMPLENPSPPVLDYFRHLELPEIYRDRPPHAALLNGIDKCIRRFHIFLDVLERYEVGFDPEAVDADLKSNVEESYDNLLDSMMEFCEDCQRVLEDIVGDASDAKAKKIVSDYKKAVRAYRDVIARSVNHVKHNQGRLRLMSALPDGRQDWVHGYYIEGMAGPNVIGPSSSLHPENMGVTFNRDLRFHFVGLFFVSQCLMTHVRFADVRFNRVERDESIEKESKREAPLGRVARKILVRPRIYFLCEKNLPKPIISIRRETLKISMAERERDAFFFGSARIVCYFTIAAGTPSYRVPFIG